MYCAAVDDALPPIDPASPLLWWLDSSFDWFIYSVPALRTVGSGAAVKSTVDSNLQGVALGAVFLACCAAGCIVRCNLAGLGGLMAWGLRLPLTVSGFLSVSLSALSW